MESREAEPLIHQLAHDYAEQRRVESEARRKAEALGKLVSAYVDLFPELGRAVADVMDELPTPGVEDGNAPKGAEAVRIVLQENIKGHYYVSDMVEELRKRGWLPESDNPANAVRAALDRLSSDDDSDVYKQRYTDRTVSYIYDPDRDRTPTYPDEEPF